MNYIASALDQSLEIIDNVPSELRESAFSIILTHLLTGQIANTDNPTVYSQLHNQALGDQTQFPDQSELTLGIRSPEPYLIKSRGSRSQQVAWAIVYLYERGDVPITTTKIRNTIKSTLGKSPPTPESTANILQSLTPQYFARSRDGRSYAYTPLQRVEELFDGIADE